MANQSTGFNLVDEPWIPCIRQDGAAVELSLAETLLQAHELQEVADESPLVTASLHRLLLAVLHASRRGPRDLDEWMAAWLAGRLDAETLARYFAQYRHRFNLFDPEWPFYQRTDMEHVNNPSSVLRLVHDRAAGNSNPFWDHAGGEAGLTPAAAARALVATQGYAFAGGVSFPIRFYDAPHMRGYTVLAKGATVFETLLLNLLPYNERTPIPQLGGVPDLPAWEQETFATPRETGTKPAGYLDFLTFQARAVLLEQDEDGLVRHCRYRQNLVLDDKEAQDPFKAYRKDEKLGWRPLVLSPGKAVWRDSHALVAGSSTERRRPSVLDHVEQASELLFQQGERERLPATRQPIDVLGLCSEPGKAIVHFWRQERLPLPLAYLDDSALQQALDRALRAAEEGLRALRRGLNALAKEILSPNPNRRGDDKAIQALANSMDVEPIYWRRLDVQFDSFLPGLVRDRVEEEGSVEYGREALRDWATTIRRAASAAFATACDTQGAGERALRAAALAGQRLQIGLAGALKELPQRRTAEPAVSE